MESQSQIAGIEQQKIDGRRQHRRPPIKQLQYRVSWFDDAEHKNFSHSKEFIKITDIVEELEFPRGVARKIMDGAYQTMQKNTKNKNNYIYMKIEKIAIPAKEVRKINKRKIDFIKNLKNSGIIDKMFDVKN